MLVAAAVCPCPPLLVPEVAAGAAPELDAAREACDEALRALVEAGPDLIVVVGQGARDQLYEAGARGSFRPFGVDVGVTLGAGSAAGDEILPPSLCVGAWLLARAGWEGPVRGHEVTADRSRPTDGEAGMGLTSRADRVGLLVMGDGTACRTVKAPGYLDERAAAVDARIAESLRTYDRDGYLAEMDAGLAEELKVSGRAPWQILSAAWTDNHADSAPSADNANNADSGTSRLLYEDAPYGVGYFVASWT
ncbi:class III extradiol dioxygenase subunit B-like domain-containing protein [Streptomyces sp. NPDC102467]|uniref:class III extradiol dioxygenase subunit B-like domain-containing protein n=1 Tax=Streptomyces sp. NPDC102467 TaxID=3366179 RepID=UPI0037FCF41B